MPDTPRRKKILHKAGAKRPVSDSAETPSAKSKARISPQARGKTHPQATPPPKTRETRKHTKAKAKKAEYRRPPKMEFSNQTSNYPAHSARSRNMKSISRQARTRPRAAAKTAKARVRKSPPPAARDSAVKSPTQKSRTQPPE